MRWWCFHYVDRGHQSQTLDKSTCWREEEDRTCFRLLTAMSSYWFQVELIKLRVARLSGSARRVSGSVPAAWLTCQKTPSAVCLTYRTCWRVTAGCRPRLCCRHPQQPCHHRKAQNSRVSLFYLFNRFTFDINYQYNVEIKMSLGGALKDLKRHRLTACWYNIRSKLRFSHEGTLKQCKVKHLINDRLIRCRWRMRGYWVNVSQRLWGFRWDRCSLPTCWKQITLDNLLLVYIYCVREKNLVNSFGSVEYNIIYSALLVYCSFDFVIDLHSRRSRSSIYKLVQ